jgi:hypothetical protein
VEPLKFAPRASGVTRPVADEDVQVVSSGLRSKKRPAGQQAKRVLVTTMLVAPAFPGDSRLALGACFIAAQAVLAYSTSGIAKLISPVWRDGTGLAGVLSTVDHGTPAVGLWLRRHSSLSKLASWVTIGFECTFIIVLVLPTQLGAGLLALGVMFQLAVQSSWVSTPSSGPFRRRTRACISQPR